MKAIKTLLAAALALVASSTMAQNYLVVQQKDGRNVEIALSAIDQVYYANYEHKFVDLGLDSGTLWAECNLGALISHDPGSYYRWGSTVAYGPADGDSWWIGDDTTDELKAKGVVNEDGYLNPAYDAATVNWGPDWAIPSPDQWDELWRQCERVDVEIEGMNCRKYTGPNGNYIIMPYAGYYQGSSYKEIMEYNNTTYFRYWLDRARHEHNALTTFDYNNRSNALPIRPVVKHLEH